MSGSEDYKKRVVQLMDRLETVLLLSADGAEVKTEPLSEATCEANVKLNQVQENIVKMFEAVVSGNFSYILRQDKVQEILGNCSDLNSLGEVIRTHLREIAKGEKDLIDWNHFMVLLIAVSLLLIFIDVNWMNLNAVAYDKQLIPFYHLDKKEIFSYLAVEESVIYNLTKSPELLLLAKVILQELNTEASNLKTVSWWLFRVYSLHEVILDEKSPQLFRKISEIIAYISNQAYVAESEDWKLKITFHLESAHIMLHFYEMAQALKQMEEVKKISGLNITLTGVLGKRTKFQQKAVSQLIVIPEEERNTRKDRPESSASYNPDILPKNITLTNDVLLSEVEYTDIGDKASMRLFPEEQAALIMQCLYVQQSNPIHELVNEEMMPYIQHVLKQPQIWSIQRRCLVIRSKLEKINTKTVERAMMQLEEIVSDYRKGTSSYNFSRFYLFFAVKPFPQWNVEGQLANLLISLGIVKNALEIFTRLEMWEEMILCYRMLERNDKAEKLIRSMLAEEETVKLLCLLGDTTKDPQHYRKAFELSGQRSSRAQRSLGNYYYYKQAYEEALPYFIKSVEINYLQPEIWFSLAFCANHVANHDLAAKAYRKCVTIEPESYEAWNNLSNSYIQLKQYPKAFSSLQEALKLSYDNWHIWENFMIVAADCGEFDDVIKSCHRLLDLKEKHVDTEVLSILVKAITENLPDAKNRGAQRLRETAEKLFGRITSVVSSNAKVWELYAQLCSSKPDHSLELSEKVLHQQQKAHRCLIHDLNWERDSVHCIRVMKQALVLCDMYHTVNKLQNSSIQILNSCKLMLKGIINTVENKLSSQNEVDSEIDAVLKEIREKLEMTLNCIEELNRKT